MPAGIKLTVIGRDLIDTRGDFAERFDAQPGTGYLLRPDQHICARWRTPNCGEDRRRARPRARKLKRYVGMRIDDSISVQASTQC